MYLLTRKKLEENKSRLLYLNPLQRYVWTMFGKANWSVCSIEKVILQESKQMMFIVRGIKNCTSSFKLQTFRKDKEGITCRHLVGGWGAQIGETGASCNTFTKK